MLLFSFLFSTLFSFGQKTSYLIPDTMLSVTLDSVMVISAKRGLTADDFISQMVSDTDFYQAFRNMSHYKFFAENSITTYKEDHQLQSRIYRKLFHNINKGRDKQQLLEMVDSGKVYKRNGDFDLYTVKMFSYIFMNEKNSDFIKEPLKKGQKGEEGYKEKLKTLIFTPGKPIEGIPLVSNKTRIFDPEYRKLYNYTFFHARYQDSIPVYQFTCVLKPELRKSKEDEVMIKELTTIFDKKNFKIMARNIQLSYFSIPFDFDVNMKIELNYVDEQLLPTKICYKGYWDIPFKEKEDCSFEVRHYGYIKN